MEAPSNKRARLRYELQQAYEAWMVASEYQADQQPGPATCIDISGSPDAAKAQWFEYLAAKERLVLAFAEHPLRA